MELQSTPPILLHQLRHLRLKESIMQEANLLGQKKSAGPIVDTRMLMHFDGSFKDEAGAITSGSNGFSTTNKKFGSASFIPGLVSVKANDDRFVTGITEATIECWLYKTGQSNWTSLISQGTSAANYTGLDCSTSGTTYDMGFIGQHPTTGARMITPLITYGVTPFNKWVHIAVVWKNKIATAYIDGIKQLSGPADYWMLRPGMDFGIASIIYAPGFAIIGQLDEFRLSAQALYSGNFTPPIEPFTF